MQHPPRAARNEHLPRGRQSKVCLILVLLAVWILPPMVATAGDTDLPRLISHNAPADPGDENWVSGFNVSGMNSTVHALAVGPDGSLYAGGAFSTAGGTPANYIARWDGSAWRSLGSGL